MKKIFTLIAVAVLAFAAQANELTVCDGTAQYANLPIYGLYVDAEGTVGQMIYPAELLTDMVGKEITQVKFYSDEIKFFDIKLQLSLKCVDKEDFEDYELVTDAVPVAECTPEAGTTELVFDLAEPFVYEGGNLLVECLVTETGTFKSVYFYGVITEYYAGIHKYTWATWSDPSVVRDQFLAKATFTYEAGDVPPVEPTERTAAPVFNGYTTDGIHAYFVEIIETEPSTIYYRVQYPGGLWSEWLEYMEILSFTGDGQYRVEAYAVAENKLPSYDIAYEFVVSPITGLSELADGKTVASKRYFNMAGQEMSEANGLTIVVTTYTDGTTSTAKVMK